MTSYFCCKSFGYIFEDKGWWLLLRADPGILNFYSWLSTRYGIPILKGSRHGPHISIVKGEKPKNIEYWKQIQNKKCSFEYSIEPRDNNYHVWLDVKSEELNDIRTNLGLSKKPFHSFHLTIGRLKYACED